MKNLRLCIFDGATMLIRGPRDHGDVSDANLVIRFYDDEGNVVDFETTKKLPVNLYQTLQQAMIDGMAKAKEIQESRASK